MSAPLLAIDAPSLLYRAFFALPDSIKGADGNPVNALLGTANLVLAEVEQHGPRAVALCFGPDAADYRVELYPPYHAERPPVPDDLAPQFDASEEFFSAFGWTVAIHDSLEADDLLGAPRAGLDVEHGDRVVGALEHVAIAAQDQRPATGRRLEPGVGAEQVVGLE